MRDKNNKELFVGCTVKIGELEFKIEYFTLGYQFKACGKHGCFDIKTLTKVPYSEHKKGGVYDNNR